MQSLNIIEFLSCDVIYINRGVVLYSVPTMRNRIVVGYNIFVGGVYENGNSSSSYMHLNTIGPWNGNLMLNEQQFALTINNYLSSLIPGQYPPISGPFNDTTTLYDLNTLQELTNQPNIFFCKILGFGNGICNAYRVSDAARNGVGVLANNLKTFQIYLEENEINFRFRRQPQTVKTISYSNILQNYTLFKTETGVSNYIQQFNWETQFELSSFNGSNTFPTFGWGGGRSGSIKRNTLNARQDSFVNFPALLLNNQNNIPVGTIYAGQGVQLSSFSNNDSLVSVAGQRPQVARQEKINNRQNINEFQDIRNTGIQPYQQGRGIFEYVSRDPIYDNIGNILSIELISTFAPEGSVPGRNNAFIGVTLTDYWSNDLNLNNQSQTSRTPKDTRYTIPKQIQTRKAHNAPMVYSSNEHNNTFNPLPWNASNTYSNSNKISDNTPILVRGVTTMIISGAYPLYRGSNAVEFSGSTIRTTVQNTIYIAHRYYSRFLSQYFITEPFWNPNFTTPLLTPEITSSIAAVTPNPPYVIKGGRILLYAGQIVNAGSFVYTTVQMTGNVNISKFFGSSAKEILFNTGSENYLQQNIYSKYQSNQGGLIVIVTTEDHPVPMIPSCCQPIGIILEDIVGTGQPSVVDGQLNFAFQTKFSVDFQPIPQSYETTHQLQNKEVLIQLFPMYANQCLSGFPTSELIDFKFSNGVPYNYPYGTTVASEYLHPNIDIRIIRDNIPNLSLDILSPCGPLYRKIRTSYIIQDGNYAYNTSLSISGDRNFNLNEDIPLSDSFKDRQLSLDWPSPQGVVTSFQYVE